MAKRNDPFIKLFVNDILGDEKLAMCSALAHGVYFRLICIMTKSDPYGTFSLHKSDANNGDIMMAFTIKLEKLMPFETEVILEGLNELIEKGPLLLDSNRVYQKRMVRDSGKKLVRSLAGREGGLKTQKKMRSLTDAEYVNDEEDGHREADNEVVPVVEDIQDYILYRKEEFDKLPIEMKEILDKEMLITEPVVWASKMIPVQYYDLVECILNTQNDDGWKLSMTRKTGKDPLWLKRKFYEFVKRIKTNYNYLEYKNEHQFRGNFSNWLEKNM